MKNVMWVGLLAAASLPLNFANAQEATPPPPGNAPQSAGTAAVPANISPGAAEVIRLAESGVGDDVVLAYIQNSQAIFNLGADDVLYLRDVGLSSPVITAMLNHDTTLRNQFPPSVNPVPTAPAEEPPPPDMESAPDYSSTPPMDVNYFYNDLAPYGTWVDLDGVGWCWQPRVVLVNHGWRPYCDNGHWLNSDAGWYWQSDYSWGWAPFHYGRWQLHNRCGWVWTPDTTWGPAWVTWRTSGDYCGWAPLPPHAVFDAGFGWRFNGARVGLDFDFGLRPDRFTFVAFKDFTRRDLGHRHLASTEVAKVYSHTTVVNNYTINNRTVVNRGIPVNRVAAATHTEIRKVAIRDAPIASGAVAGMTRFEKGTAVVYRPQLHRPANPINAVAQKVDARHPVIQHSTITAMRNVPTRSYTAPRSPGESSRPLPRNEIERRSTPPRQSVPRTYQQTPSGPPGNPGRYGEDFRSTPRNDRGAVDSFRAPSPQSSFGERQQVPRYYSPGGYQRSADSHPMVRPEARQPVPSAPTATGTGSNSRSRNGS
jgi:hypothetical protein